jgi:hypothetical protein
LISKWWNEQYKLSLKREKRKEHTHGDKIECLTDDNRGAAAKPEPRRGIFDSHTKRGSATRIVPQNVLHAPQALAHILA